MSRNSRLDRSEVPQRSLHLYHKDFAQRGNVPNMFRVMAHRPQIFSTVQARESEDETCVIALRLLAD
jgi:hypothetical protein